MNGSLIIKFIKGENMTKINKLGKSTFVIAILSFILVAVLAFGGTYAYFSATSGKVEGSINMGNLTIGEVTGTAIKDVAGTKKVTFTTNVAQPNQVILDETLSATVTTNIAYYTRVKFDVTVEVAPGHAHKHGTETSCADYFANAIDALIITATNSGWEIGDSKAGTDASKMSSAYYYKLAPTAENADDRTEEFAVKVQAKPILGLYESGNADGCTYWQDATITIAITFEVLQADYLVNGTTEGGIFTADGEKSAGKVAEAAWDKALTGVQSGTDA